MYTPSAKPIDTSWWMALAAVFACLLLVSQHNARQVADTPFTKPVRLVDDADRRDLDSVLFPIREFVLWNIRWKVRATP